MQERAAAFTDKAYNIFIDSDPLSGQGGVISVGFYKFDSPTGVWWDISTESRLTETREQLKTAIMTYAVGLCREFEDNYVEATKKLMDDGIFDAYHIRLSFIASQLGNEYIAERAKSIYDSLNDNFRQQVSDYKQGDRSKMWMINPNNMRRWCREKDYIGIIPEEIT